LESSPANLRASTFVQSRRWLSALRLFFLVAGPISF